MALQKSKTTQFGVPGDYWRILQLNCNYDRMDAVCTIGLYIDEASRNADNSPVDSFQVDLGGQFHNENYKDGEDAMKNISLKAAYKALKRMATDEAAKPDDPEVSKNDDLAFFADAVDV